MSCSPNFSLTRTALLVSAIFVAQPVYADAIDEVGKFLMPSAEAAEPEAPKTEEVKTEATASNLPPATLLDEKKLDAFFNKKEEEKAEPKPEEKPVITAPVESKKPAAEAPKPEEKPAAPVELKTEEKKPAEELLASKNVNDAPSAEVALPVFPVADPKEFNTMLAYVFANHPQLKAQRESLKATDESVALALSGFRPDVGAGYTKGRERNKQLDGSWGYDNTTSKSLVVTQQIFNGGETLANYAVAKDTVKAARAQLSAVEQQVIYNAVVAYSDVVEKQAVLELNQKNVDVLKQQLEATQARFDVGELTVTDTSQSRARLANAEANERQALGDLEAAKATFKRVIGYDVSGKIAMPGVPAGLPASLSEANSWAQEANPILEAARHSEEAASDNVYAQSSALLPDVSVQGIISRADGGSIGGLSNRDNDALLLNISIPIYQSGAEWARIRQARSQAQQAKFATLDTHGSVVESVSRAWEDYNTATAIITSSEAALRAAETALDGVRKENEFGVRTILDVLDAEQEAFSARVNLVKAVRAEKVQAYRLLASVGRLTANDLKLETDVPNPKEHYDSIKYQLLGL